MQNITCDPHSALSPTQLSIACSTEMAKTANNEKLGGAWEWG